MSEPAPISVLNQYIDKFSEHVNHPVKDSSGHTKFSRQSNVGSGEHDLHTEKDDGRVKDAEDRTPYLVAFTFSSHWNPQMCTAFSSALKNNVNVVLLGMNEVHDKKQKIMSFFEAAAIWPYPNDIAIFMDAYDVLFQQDANALLKVFESFNSDIVIGAEKNCWPPQLHRKYCRMQRGNPDIERLYPRGSLPVRYVNTGVLMGRIWAAERWYYENAVAMSKITLPGDQAYAAVVMQNDDFKRNYTVKLDYESKLVQNMHLSLADVRRNPETGLFQNKYTKAVPAMMHFNGDKEPLQYFSKIMNFREKKMENGAGIYLPSGKYVPLKDLCPGIE